MAAYARVGVELWSVPARSPDLNPVEMFWAWLKKKLRSMDLEDLKLKRRTLGKTAYKERVRRLLTTAKAKQVAQNCAKRLYKIRRQVVVKKGAASN